MTQVICDSCNKEFEMNLQSRKVERDIDLVYFTCTHYKHEYKSYYTNAKTRTRQERIKKLFAKTRLTIDDELDAIYARIDKLKNQNLIEIQGLRNRFDKDIGNDVDK